MDRNRLFSYHQWATLECLRHVQMLGEDLYRREGQNSFASIEKTMEHVIGVEKLWLMRMAATEDPTFEYFDVETTEKAIEAFMLLHAEMELYMSALTEEQWQEKLKFKNMRGDEFENSREEMLFTVINHGTYHRGQVTSFLRQFGKEGIALDYLYFKK
ncbi:DinB family protein [Planomicrobium chinense]|uniref:DinB family protein n=1 Tax=Planococcus chinensis TaxID=272917 RepID=UPI001CC34F99|nr:DinB family protein [Planococcus chinensis]MBZ5202772.1 DinB family protein [Planococcus chinensis]MCP2036632.1 putative damage-inducible protein DinB [Planomicrobium sp. HSC-17F08]